MAPGYNTKRVISDDLIGEAVIVLLKSGGPITISALLEQLSSMATTTEDEHKRLACLQSIDEVKLSISRHFAQRSEYLERQNSLLTNSISSRSHTNDTKH